VCFAFNGGPGSASVWLHLGALGPKRVVVPDDARPHAPYTGGRQPADLAGALRPGLHRPAAHRLVGGASEAARKRMLSVDGDVEALTEVMRVWLTRHQRWGSPVYLAGESYGTTRGAALADSAADRRRAFAG
jgi:carboxypeptidase C (cathepsin A)